MFQQNMICIWYDDDWRKICIRIYIHKNTRASYGVSLMGIWVTIGRVITAPYCSIDAVAMYNAVHRYLFSGIYGRTITLHLLLNQWHRSQADLSRVVHGLYLPKRHCSPIKWVFMAHCFTWFQIVHLYFISDPHFCHAEFRIKRMYTFFLQGICSEN